MQGLQRPPPFTRPSDMPLRGKHPPAVHINKKHSAEFTDCGKKPRKKYPADSIRAGRLTPAAFQESAGFFPASQSLPRAAFHGSLRLAPYGRERIRRVQLLMTDHPLRTVLFSTSQPFPRAAFHGGPRLAPKAWEESGEFRTDSTKQVSKYISLNSCRGRTIHPLRGAERHNPILYTYSKVFLASGAMKAGASGGILHPPDHCTAVRTISIMQFVVFIIVIHRHTSLYVNPAGTGRTGIGSAALSRRQRHG